MGWYWIKAPPTPTFIFWRLVNFINAEMAKNFITNWERKDKKHCFLIVKKFTGCNNTSGTQRYCLTNFAHNNIIYRSMHRNLKLFHNATSVGVRRRGTVAVAVKKTTVLNYKCKINNTKLITNLKISEIYFVGKFSITCKASALEPPNRTLSVDSWSKMRRTNSPKKKAPVSLSILKN